MELVRSQGNLSSKHLPLQHSHSVLTMPYCGKLQRHYNLRLNENLQVKKIIHQHSRVIEALTVDQRNFPTMLCS
jgi:hypothetical protein